jgi:hypothetical protein
MHRAHIGERHAGLQAEPRGRVVHRGHAQRGFDRLYDNERRVTR